MKFPKILSVLSIIFCLVYMIGAFALAVFPKDMCILFGMENFLRISPDYIAHSITTELTKEAYEINPVYTVSQIAVTASCLIPVIVSALLALSEKTKLFPILLASFSALSFLFSSILVQTATEYTYSSRYPNNTDFYIINSIYRFILLFGICGAVLCVISALYAKSKLSVQVLSIISICFAVIYLIPNIGTLILNPPLNEYGKYYSIAAIIFIVLSALSYFGKINKRNAYFALELAAFFPLAFQLFLMFGTGDYFGFMHLNSQINDNDLVLYKWLISGILCAVSSLKGVYNENPENA